MATVQLVTGSGSTIQADGYRLSGFPWVFFGGSVDTRVCSTTTGDVTYYALDNSETPVYRLKCLKDVTLAPTYNEFEDWCDGQLISKKVLQGFTQTMTLTEDIVDLSFLRWFFRQPAGSYDWEDGCSIESLLIGNMCSQVMPVLWEHHYVHCSSADMYMGILAFEAELSLGDISVDGNEGYSAELTIAVRYSNTYGAYLALMRYDPQSL